MAIKKLEKPMWHVYFDELTRIIVGKNVEIEVGGLTIGAQIEVEKLPFYGITYDHKNDLIEIVLEGLDHMIPHPKEVYIDQDGVVLHSIEIIDNNDFRQIVQFIDPLMLPPPSQASRDAGRDAGGADSNAGSNPGPNPGPNPGSNTGFNAISNEVPTMISDEEIRKNVEEELRFDPDIDVSDIAVSVRGGIVSLSGFVPSYAQKLQAEADAKRVAGVVAVANDLEVRVPAVDERPDPDLARDAVAAIKTQLPYSWENIKVIVREGWITLEGTVEWNYQRERAEEAVRWIKGVKGVINTIDVKPKVTPTEIKLKIEEAFKRHAEIDANRIEVEARDGEVILKGTVHSWFERKEAERAAWSAPGVRKVEDRIVVVP